jgi:hypothetical protein
VIATDKSCALVLLVAMTRAEALETTKIYSALGLAEASSIPGRSAPRIPPSRRPP